MGPRPNYYETLGLAPTAASDEIAKAFAKATSVFRPHAFGAITEVCLAYETLRNPIKRRAYDISLGLRSEPGPQVSPAIPREAPSPPRPVSPYPVERTAVSAASVSASVPQANPAPRPEASAVPSALPRQSLERNAVEGTSSPIQKPELQSREDLDNKFRFAPQIGGDVSRHLSLEEQFLKEASPVDWKRIGKAAGAVAGAACVLGVLAGWWSTGDIGEQQQPQKAASSPLPPAEPVASSDIPQPSPPQAVQDAIPDRPKRAAAAAARIESRPALPQVAAAEQRLEDMQPGDGQSQESQPGLTELGVSEQDTASAPSASTVAASLPLPNKVISRTIERIGYSCGGVTSSTPVEGAAPGVYKVTCASGQTYQARPVNGRYRFRVWGRK